VGRHDWYRQTQWGVDEQRLFEEKLGRARASNRSQYLRIQGLTLTWSQDPRVRRAGRELLLRVIRDHVEPWPEEARNAMNDLADSFAGEGALADAERWYRACAALQDSATDGLRLDCHLGLAEVLLRRKPNDLGSAEEAAAAIDRAAQLTPPVWPAQRWRFCVVLARIAVARGELEKAQEFAAMALDTAAMTESPFPYHRELGLAAPTADERAEMEKLAGEGYKPRTKAAPIPPDPSTRAKLNRAVNRALRNVVWPALSREGFTRRSERTAWRDRPDQIDVVRFWANNAPSFQIELGTLPRCCITQDIPTRDGLPSPDEAFCEFRTALRKREPHAEAPRDSLWFISADGSNIAEVVEHARAVLLDDGMSWFSALDGLERMLAVARSPDDTGEWLIARPGSPARKALVATLEEATEARKPHSASALDQER
jgi:MalT-like TPR region